MWITFCVDCRHKKTSPCKEGAGKNESAAIKSYKHRSQTGMLNHLPKAAGKPDLLDFFKVCAENFFEK